MRLKKGSKVEVFQDGFWCPAQILCGNGRIYSVQCDTAAKNVEKIPRKWIRPCPPLKGKLINWKSGDIAEVLIHGSWRNVRVSGVAYGNNFIFVNLVDISREISVKRNNVRLRHTWQNNKWVTVKKDSEAKEMRRKMEELNSRGGDAKKPQLEFKKVIQGETYANNNSCENESMVSSTGSCSTSGSPGNCASFSWTNDDAMSSCEPIEENKNRGDELLLKGEGHKREIDEYSATLRAFYKNGSISWEQEKNLSNMRLHLNISSDEYRSLSRSVGSSKRREIILS